MEIGTLLTPFLAAAASFVGAWLAARFALHRFYQEKAWERKAAAYTVIFEALHQMETRFDIEYNAIITYQDVPEDEAAKHAADYQAAKTSLYRTMAGQTWVLSEHSQELLKKLDLELSKSRDSLHDIYDHGLGTIQETTATLKKLAQEDLKIHR
jgi:hypothetical protein